MKQPFCAFPFMQLFLRPTGKVGPCCRLQDHVLGDITKETLMEIWNGEKMQALRREFLAGEIKTCAVDIRRLRCDRESAHLLPHVERTAVQSGPPRLLDVRLNGRCNLQCVMCEVWKMPNGLYDEERFWRVGAREIFPFLLEMEVLGGEPFIQRDTFRLIDEISACNKECRWFFTTNGHWKFTDYIRGHLDRIEIGALGVSIDSLDPGNYARIRIGGDLSVVLRTLDDLRAYSEERSRQGRGFPVEMDMVTRIDNYREIPGYVAYARERKIKPGLGFQWAPKEGSIGGAPERERREAYDFLRNEYERGLNEVQPMLVCIQEFMPPEVRLEFFAEEVRRGAGT